LKDSDGFACLDGGYGDISIVEFVFVILGLIRVPSPYLDGNLLTVLRVIELLSLFFMVEPAVSFSFPQARDFLLMTQEQVPSFANK
jgi:hypothetical protein